MNLRSFTCFIVVLGLAQSAPIRADLNGNIDVISRGQVVELADKIVLEKPTVFVFMKPSSSLERSFLAQLQTDAGTKVGIRVVELKTGQEPIAVNYEIIETPTAIIYDRRKRLVIRTSDPDKIKTALKKAGGVMRIDWAEEGDEHYVGSVKALGRPPGTGILRTMTLQPEYLKYINDLSIKAHFSDGFLPRRVKEMIATYVSQLNGCKY